MLPNITRPSKPTFTLSPLLIGLAIAAALVMLLVVITLATMGTPPQPETITQTITL